MSIVIRKKKQHKNNWLIVILIAFLVAAAVFGLLAGTEEYAKALVREKIKNDSLGSMTGTENVIEVPADGYLAVPGEDDSMPDLDIISGWIGIAKYINKDGTDEYESLHLAGVIEIPALDIEEPVWKENTNVALRYGVILMEDSAALEDNGNSVIVGHRNIMTKTIFYNLTDIKQDDEAYISTVDGRRQKYRVNGTYYCSPYDLQDYVAGASGDSKTVTLVTCAREYGNTWRFIVTLVPDQD